MAGHLAQDLAAVHVPNIFPFVLLALTLAVAGVRLGLPMVLALLVAMTIWKQRTGSERTVPYSFTNALYPPDATTRRPAGASARSTASANATNEQHSGAYS